MSNNILPASSSDGKSFIDVIIEERLSRSRSRRSSFNDYAEQMKLATEQAIAVRKSQEVIIPLKTQNDPKVPKKKSKKEVSDDLKKDVSMTEHLDTIDVLIERFHTDPLKVFYFYLYLFAL